MKFSVEQEFDHPLELVLEAREKRYELLPELKKPEILEEEEQGSLVKTKKRFTISGGLPKSMKKFIPMDSMDFIDHSTWDNATHIHTWDLISTQFSDYLEWRGTTTYEAFEQAGKPKTRRRMEGVVNAKIPIMGKKLEKMMVDGMEKNFAKDHRTICEAIAKMG